MKRKVGRLINDSAFVVLNDVTWPIRTNCDESTFHSFIKKNLESFLVFDEVQILQVWFFQTYMPRKIPKHVYKP